MESNSIYKKGYIPNILKKLDLDESFLLIRIALTANDLNTNIQCLDKFTTKEGSYFLYNSISIIRELAKLIEGIDKHNLKDRFSSKTSESYSSLKTTLGDFSNDSFIKSTLKPIRDIHLHYFNVSEKHLDRELVDSLIKKLSGDELLDISQDQQNDSVLRFRYTFADQFRNQYIESIINDNLIGNIAQTGAYVVTFVDYLCADLAEQNASP